jgi:hypothetical protein
MVHPLYTHAFILSFIHSIHSFILLTHYPGTSMDGLKKVTNIYVWGTKHMPFNSKNGMILCSNVSFLEVSRQYPAIPKLKPFWTKCPLMWAYSLYNKNGRLSSRANFADYLNTAHWLTRPTHPANDLGCCSYLLTLSMFNHIRFFLISGMGLWVLRPLLAYCTSPG